MDVVYCKEYVGAEVNVSVFVKGSAYIFNCTFSYTNCKWICVVVFNQNKQLSFKMYLCIFKILLHQNWTIRILFWIRWLHFFQWWRLYTLRRVGSWIIGFWPLRLWVLEFVPVVMRYLLQQDILTIVVLAFTVTVISLQF